MRLYRGLILALILVVSFAGAQDLDDPSTIGRKNKNQAVSKGLQIEDTLLSKGAVWFPELVNTVGTDSVLTTDDNGFLKLIIPAGSLLDMYEVSYATLTNAMSAKALNSGGFYKITDFRSKHKVINVGIVSDSTAIPDIEQIVVMATSDSTISEEAYSMKYPNDVIRYDPFPPNQVARAMDYGMITYRLDVDRQLSAHYDWREVLMVRYNRGAPDLLNYVYAFPDGGTTGGEWVKTFTNLDVRNVQNVHIPAVSAELRTFLTAALGVDIWNNLTTFKWSSSLLSGVDLSEGNFHFGSNVLFSSFDGSGQGTLAGGYSQMDNITIEGDCFEVTIFTDTTQAPEGAWKYDPLVRNVYSQKGISESVIKNPFLSDVRFYGNAKLLRWNAVELDHVIFESNLSVGAADTCHMDSVRFYVCTIGPITAQPSGSGVSRLKNVEASLSHILDLADNWIKNTEFSTVNRIMLTGNNNWTSNNASTFTNWNGGGLYNSNWNAANLENITGVVDRSFFNYATVSDVNFATTDSLVLTGDAVTDAAIGNTNFFGGISEAVVTAVDTMTGAISNTDFADIVIGNEIGVKILNSKFNDTMNYDLTIQQGTFENNTIWCGLSDNPTEAGFWSPSTVTYISDELGVCSLESGGGGAFTTTSNVTSNSPGTLATDDFVFGSDQLNDDADATHDARFLFDKSTGAFRAGTVSSTQWDIRGVSSTALGNNTTAMGTYAFASGNSTSASGQSATAIGELTTATQRYALAGGYQTTAQGRQSLSFGQSVVAYSGAEAVLGMYSTSYTANSATGFDAADRLFTLGNGTAHGSRSDALTVLKNGSTSIGVSNFEANTSGTLLQVNGAVQVMAIDTFGLGGHTVGVDNYRIIKTFSNPANADTIYIDDLTGVEMDGVEFHFKEPKGGTSNNWYIATTGTDKIDNADVYPMDAEGKSVTLYWFNDEWLIE